MKTNSSIWSFLFFMLCLLTAGCDSSNGSEGMGSLTDKMKYAHLEAQLDASERKLLAILKAQRLTEDKLSSFIDATQTVKEVAGEEALTAFTRKHQLCSEVKHAIEATGWDAEEFYRTGRKIAFVFTVLKGKEMADPRHVKEEYETQMQEYSHAMESMLQDPNIDESTKEEIKKSIQQAKESSRAFDNFESKKWRKKVEKTQQELDYILQKAASPQEITLVKKHMQQIEPIIGLLDPSLVLQGVDNATD